jgi:hypothetical protein
VLPILEELKVFERLGQDFPSGARFVMNFIDTVTLQAFSLARLQLAPVLDQDLEAEIHEVGDRVAQKDPRVADEVRALVNQHRCLRDYYEVAYQDIQQHYQHQERAKQSADAAVVAIALQPPHWEQVVVEILQADAPIQTIRHLMRQLKTQPAAFATGMLDGFFAVLQKVLVDLDSHAIAILKALSERPHTLYDLKQRLDESDPHVESVTHMLWNEGYIGRLNDSLWSRVVPLFCSRLHREPLNPEDYLALTAKGHFMLRPVVTVGQRSTAAK